MLTKEQIQAINELIQQDYTESDSDMQGYDLPSQDTVVIVRENRREYIQLPLSRQEIEIEDPFMEYIYQLMDERGIEKDSDVYKKAGLSRSQWGNYKNSDTVPNKQNAIAIALAMRLDVQETEELLNRIGFTLSRSSKWDCVIKACINNCYYDLIDVNMVLSANNLEPLFKVRNVL